MEECILVRKAAQAFRRFPFRARHLVMSKSDSLSFEVREPYYEDPYIRTVLSTIPHLPDFRSADDITLSLTWVEQLQWNDTFNANDNDIDALQPPLEPHLNDVGTILSLVPITLPSPSAPQIDVL